MLGRPPRYLQYLKDPPLAPPLHQTPLRDPLPIPSPNDIPPQTPLVQPKALLTRQQPNTPIEDIVPREIDQRRAHFLVRHEQEIDPSPHLSLVRRAWEAGAPVPFRARGGPRCRRCEGSLQVIRCEKPGDDRVQDYGPQDLDPRVRLHEDEIHVPRTRCAAAVRAPYRDLDAGIHMLDCVADELAVLLDFLAGDTGGEVFDVVDANFLVFGQGDFGAEVLEGAVALVDPLGGLGGADAVDGEEELKGDVAGVEVCVFEAAEAVREGDFFDLGGEAGADVGDGEGGFFGGDFLGLGL